VPQAVWTGTLSFGLVSIPVRLYNATSPKDVRFRELQAGTARRVRRRRVVEPGPELPASDPAAELPRSDRGHGRPSGSEPPPAVRHVEAPTGETPPRVREPEPEAVAYDEVVKGFEIQPDRFVVLDPSEIAALAPERTRTIDIAEFVDLADIDPVYFEKSYYVAPAAGGERPYWLLHRAMREASRVAVATFVMRTREYLAAVRPAEEVLVLETLFFADEVRDPRELALSPPQEPRTRELDMASRLLESLVTTWDPSRYRDRYRERVMELIQSRAEGAVDVGPPAEEPVTPAVHDLMAALQASLDAIKAERQPVDRPKRSRAKQKRTG
jgi:DNA end-binding protein Ku